jgi:hypothetical protein
MKDKQLKATIRRWPGVGAKHWYIVYFHPEKVFRGLGYSDRGYVELKTAREKALRKCLAKNIRVVD